MSSALAKAIKGITPTVTQTEVDVLVAQKMAFTTVAAVTTTTAIAETPIGAAKQACRVRNIYITPAAALTAHASNYATVLIKKRPAAAPGTPVTMATFATDTVTTDDLVAFARKSLASFLTATAADLQLVAGDVVSVEVTKAASGVTFPITAVEVELAPVS